MANKQLMLPANRAFNSDGLPIAGCVARLYTTGTLNPAVFYSNSSLSVSLGSSLTANGAGRFAVRAWQNETTPFRLRIEDPEGTVIDDIDPFYFGYLQGATGPQGINATVLELGAVTTLSPGANATAAVNDEGGGLYSLDLGLPRGTAGGVVLSDGDYGDVSVSGGGATMSVDAGAITSAKMANMAAGTVKGRAVGGGTGVPTDLNGTAIEAILDAGNAYVRQNASLLRAIPIMATAMVSRATNGAAEGLTETATNKIMVVTKDFDASTNEYAQFSIAMPKSWDEGTIDFSFIWTATATGDVVWNVSGVAVSDDDVLDAAFGSVVSVTDSVTAANDVMISSFTGAVTLAGTPAASDVAIFQIARNAGIGADTLAVDAKLIGVRMHFVTNAKDDT